MTELLDFLDAAAIKGYVLILVAFIVVIGIGFMAMTIKYLQRLQELDQKRTLCRLCERDLVHLASNRSEQTQ